MVFFFAAPQHFHSSLRGWTTKVSLNSSSSRLKSPVWSGWSINRPVAHHEGSFSSFVLHQIAPTVVTCLNCVTNPKKKIPTDFTSGVFWSKQNLSTSTKAEIPSVSPGSLRYNLHQRLCVCGRMKIGRTKGTTRFTEESRLSSIIRLLNSLKPFWGLNLVAARRCNPKTGTRNMSLVVKSQRCS